MAMQATLPIRTPGRGLVDITRQVSDLVSEWSIEQGLCHVFLQHTSAGLIIAENADRAVGRDLERYFAKLVRDGDPLFEHDAEGPDDMPAHIRSILTGVSLSIPIAAQQLLLGVWQGIYLWEHRHAEQQRSVIVTALA